MRWQITRPIMFHTQNIKPSTHTGITSPRAILEQIRLSKANLLNLTESKTK